MRRALPSDRLLAAAAHRVVTWMAVLLATLLVGGAAYAEGVAVCGAAIEVSDDQRAPLAAFAQANGLTQIDAFVGTVAALWKAGRLPDCYLTKRAAEERGWRPSEDLWRVAPGTAIGGDRFGNREARLPAGGRYREADLDYAGGHRGARRLIFAESPEGVRVLWITVDHYASFHLVPGP
jgi:ribonuclease T1